MRCWRAAVSSASSESIPSSSNRRRARLGPRPGRRVISSRPAGNFSRSADRLRDVAVLEQRRELRLERRADPRQLGGATGAHERRDRGRGVADRLGRVAVGDDAVDDRAVELVEVAELVERRGDLAVRRVGHRVHKRRCAAMRRSVIVERCRPTTSRSSAAWTPRARRSRAGTRAPGPVLRAGRSEASRSPSLLLLAVWLVATRRAGDPTPLAVVGLTTPPDLEDVAPRPDAQRARARAARVRLRRRLHRRQLAAARGGATARHLAARPRRSPARSRSRSSRPRRCSRSRRRRTCSATSPRRCGQLGTSPGALLLGLLPHALLELWALFLPLAAWLIASRRRRLARAARRDRRHRRDRDPGARVSSLVEVYVVTAPRRGAHGLLYFVK